MDTDVWAGDSVSLSSSSSSTEEKSLVVGFVACAIAAFGFGSNFLPVKKIYSGNGIFFQWAMCIAIWLVGLCVYVYQSFPKFEPMAMLGGALWCSGNVMAVPIINMIGMALGMSVWCVANMAIGWASGAFGILGVQRQTVKHPILNYVGAGLAIVSIVLFASIKSDFFKNGGKCSGEDDPNSVVIGGEEKEDDEAAKKPLLGKGNVQDAEPAKPKEEEDGMASCLKGLNPKISSAIGLIMAVVSGFFYGTNFNPPQYRIEHGPEGTSRNVLDYVFPHFTGILCTSTLFVVIYCCVTRNNPTVYNRSMFPGFISGSIWAVAQVAWFVANKNLDFTISFPIITSGPAIFASLWGVLLFHEITGKAQLITMLVGFLVTITGVVFITLSKVA